jgi:hypothetical protein
MTAGSDGSWTVDNVPAGTWRAIAMRDGRWSYITQPVAIADGKASVRASDAGDASAVELIRDRREDMSRPIGP